MPIKRANQIQSSAITCNHAPLRLDGPLLQPLLLLLLLCQLCLRFADECLLLQSRDLAPQQLRPLGSIALSRGNLQELGTARLRSDEGVAVGGHQRQSEVI